MTATAMPYETRRQRDAEEAAATERLIAAIGALMAPEWMLATESEGAYREGTFTHADGPAFSIRRDLSGKRDRLSIMTWKWPQYTSRDTRNPGIGDGTTKTRVTPRELREPKEEVPSISVAISRGPEAIVKEIRRRFLPEYTRIYARCAERAAEAQAYEDKATGDWEAICKLIGPKATDRRETQYLDTAAYVRITNSPGSGARIEMTCNVEQCRAVFAALRSISPEKK